jgi:hypothetical protein
VRLVRAIDILKLISTNFRRVIGYVTHSVEKREGRSEKLDVRKRGISNEPTAITLLARKRRRQE